LILLSGPNPYSAEDFQGKDFFLDKKQDYLFNHYSVLISPSPQPIRLSCEKSPQIPYALLLIGIFLPVGS
jgi:hypothetical protein